MYHNSKENQVCQTKLTFLSLTGGGFYHFIVSIWCGYDKI